MVPLGVLWRPWAPQGTPQGSRGEKTTKKGVRRPPPGTPVGGPLRDLGRHRADIFFVFGCRVGDLCDDRRFDGQNVLHERSPRPPQTMKPKVSPTRKRCFHLSTRTSTMTENGVQWVPFWVAFRSFWAPWGRKRRQSCSQRGRWEVQKSMSKKTLKKGCAGEIREIREIQGIGGGGP